VNETSNVIIGGLNADELVGITLMVIAVLGLLFSRMSGGEKDDTDF
jgi:hypothetical protein